MMTMTATDIQSALKIMVAVTEAIHEADSIPSGVLYSNLMGQMSLGTYESMICQIVRTGLISESNHLLTWEGPK